ncbi:MAG TPA: HAMP domain-containing sensor histidine kinase [Anaerolineae bacterium]|nr:HAMP domain-containing sensor histidine kinase [Anaerolineae bacterium]
MKIKLFDIPSLDPDDVRRRKLLNIMLIGVSVVASLVLLYAFYGDLSNSVGADYLTSLYRMGGITLGGILLCFFLNRYGPSWLASSLFLVLLVGAMGYAMPPEELVGSGLFFLTIPVLMASTVVRPWASFAAALVCGGLVTYDEIILYNQLPIPSIAGFFIMATVSWLAARSLESALQELRVFNAELEQRVKDRTAELQQANRELTEAYEKLKELDRLKSRFVSMVSHELRTPLSAIQGFAEMLESGFYGTINSGQQGAIDRIKANDQRLLSLVNDLLDQARMEAGQLSLHVAPFSPTGLMGEMESTMRVLTEAKGLYLRTDIASDVPQTLSGDSKRLHQILVNLINNAIKFTQSGGITVRLYCPDPQHWTIAVADTGPGIPEDALNYIFEPFRQVDSSATREHKGFGLGLAIVKQLAELMGGGVRVTSEMGQGSTFIVTLPITSPQTENA